MVYKSVHACPAYVYSWRYIFSYVQQSHVFCFSTVAADVFFSDSRRASLNAMSTDGKELEGKDRLQKERSKQWCKTVVWPDWHLFNRKLLEIWSVVSECQVKHLQCASLWASTTLPAFVGYRFNIGFHLLVDIRGVSVIAKRTLLLFELI